MSDITDRLHDYCNRNNLMECDEEFVADLITEARTEAAAEMKARAAEVARGHLNRFKFANQQMAIEEGDEVDDPETQAFYDGKEDAASLIERDILALSPDPDYSARIRREVIEEAAKLVCGYCDGHFPQWNRQAERGVSGSGNWVHGMKDAPDRLTLCAATGIYNKLEFDRALKEKVNA